LAVALAAAPARAFECHSIPECLSLLPRLDPRIVAVGAALTAGVLAAGGLVTALQPTDRPLPTGATVNGRRYNLNLIPPADPDPPPEEAESDPKKRHERAQNEGLLRFNDIASTAVIVAGGAAIVGSIIAGIAKKH
jgi:hypothetical protein